MGPRLARAALVVLALSAALVGVWATIAPHSFYADFPGLGRHWVSADGPYNEHLVRDVGELNLALLTLTIATIVRPALRLITGIAWLTYTVPHFLYHVGHLDVYDALDTTLNVVTLTANILLAVLLVPPSPPRRHDPEQPRSGDRQHAGRRVHE